MSKMLARVVAVSAGIETAYNGGTPDPAFSSCNLLFRNGSVLSLDQQVIDLNELRGSLTKSGYATGRTLYRITPSYDIMGHLNAQSAFRLDAIFKMCSMAVTPAGSSLTYKFRSTDTPNQSGVLNVCMDSAGANAIVAKVTGAYGTFRLAGAAGQPITMDTTITGRFNTPTNPAIPAKALPTNTVETMKAVNMAIFPETAQGSGTYGAALTPALKFKSFTLDAGNDVQEDPDANATDGVAGVDIVDRNPSMTFVVGLDDALYDDFVGHLTGGLKNKIVFRHGSVAGRFMTLTATGQPEVHDIGEDAKKRILSIQYKMCGADDDELALMFS